MGAFADAAAEGMAKGKCCGCFGGSKTILDTRRRLAEVPDLPWEQKPAPIVRRLAAIPIDLGTPQSVMRSQRRALPEQKVDSSTVSLGVLSSAIVCIGCVLQRYYRQLKNKIQRREGLGARGLDGPLLPQ